MKHATRLTLLFGLCFAAVAWPQTAKRTLKPADYDLWEMPGSARISNDGHWFVYGLSRVEGDRRLIVRNVDTPQQVEVPNGAAAAFSEDSKWVGYVIGPSRKEADAARDRKQPFESRFILKNLATGAEKPYEAVQSFQFLKTSRFLLVQRMKLNPAVEGGTDLLVVNLETGAETVFGNVNSAIPNRDGTVVALAVDSGGKYGGVQLLDPTTSSLRTVVWGKERVSGLAWAKDSDILAYFTSKDDEKKNGPWNTISLVAVVRKPAPTVTVIDPAKLEGFPKDYRIAEFRGIDLAEDGSSLVFGIRKWEDKKKPSPVKPEDKPDVDVWHYKDLETQPEQQRQGPRGQMKVFTCLWRDGKFTQVEDEKFDNATVMRGNRFAYGADPKPYQTPTRAEGIVYADWYVVDLGTGKRTKVIERLEWPVFGSNTGRYLSYYKKGDWWIYDIQKSTHTNLTGKLGVSFADEEYDGPQKEKPFGMISVWFDEDRALMLRDRYDYWQVDPATGKAVKWTDGRKEKVRFQLLNLSTEGERLNVEQPIYLTAFNEETKASGVGLRNLDGSFKVLTMDGARIDLTAKAKSADRMIFRYQTFEKSPDFYVTNGIFQEAKPLSKTNPQQADFLWGKSELVRYKSKWGKELSGILIYPADYKQGRSYPMVTYIYERLSDGLHEYRPPIDRDSYDAQVLSQNGYFVFMPDIAYRVREPGVSAVECLEPAVAAVIAKRVGVDARRVGLMGHSWGAYQTAYAVTVSKTFAAGVAGAPLTDMVSMYGSFYWNSGTPNQVLFEASQGRFGVPWWEDLKAYMDNSPVFQAGKMNKPLMIAFGDNDGAVDWHQGQYLYNTLRRMGKFIIMLVYPGENHGLAKKGNQLDYAHRLRHFFDVYLKGAKPEPWVTEGVPFVKKEGT